MRLWARRLLVFLLVFVFAVPASAMDLGSGIIINPGTGLTDPIFQVSNQPPVPVAFSAIANKYAGVDPATVFDLSGDLVGDLKVGATAVTAQNGAKVQLIQPAQVNLDQVQLMPTSGYGASAPLQLSRVYALQLANGTYAKFMVLQASPKVTIWFHYGTPTTSVLKADGQGSNAVLTWDPLADAALGYNIYRYEVNDDSYTVTQLNDLTVQATTFTDNTASNRYYLYTVQAIKAGGAPGALSTVAAISVQFKKRNMVVTLNSLAAKLDGANLTLTTKPVIKDGLLMAPASMLTNTGTKVTLSGSTLTLSRRIESVTYTVVMTLDTPEYSWNGITYKTDVPPYKAGAEVMVPLRVVAPVLGLGLTFNSVDRSATIAWAE